MIKHQCIHAPVSCLMRLFMSISDILGRPEGEKD
jgi:hypothetical protein